MLCHFPCTRAQSRFFAGFLFLGPSEHKKLAGLQLFRVVSCILLTSGWTEFIQVNKRINNNK